MVLSSGTQQEFIGSFGSRALSVGRGARVGILVLAAGLGGCGFLDQQAVEREASAVEEKLGRVGAVNPERPGFRSLIRSRHPYLGLKEVVAPGSLLPEELRSDSGVVVTLVDGARDGLPGDQGIAQESVVPGDEVLARRIEDAAGISVRISGSARLAADEDVSVSGGEAAASGDANSWLSSWADEMAGEAGVWAGPLDELLDAWTQAAGYRWHYDADAGTVEVVRSETVVFDVHALQGKQTYNVTTATQGSGGDETSGSSSHTITSEMVYDPWAEVGTQAKTAAGSEGAISISATSGTVTVSGRPRAIERVRQYLEHINEHLLRPVTLSVHLYSVRFDKGSDYEVGLSGLLPEAFGSNFQIGVESGSISIVKPMIAGGSTLQATVSALRSVGRASRLLSADVSAVSRVPGVFYDLFEQAYLKEVTTTVDDGVSVGSFVLVFVLMLGAAGGLLWWLAGDDLLRMAGLGQKETREEPLVEAVVRTGDFLRHCQAVMDARRVSMSGFRRLAVACHPRFAQGVSKVTPAGLAGQPVLEVSWGLREGLDPRVYVPLAQDMLKGWPNAVIDDKGTAAAFKALPLVVERYRAEDATWAEPAEFRRRLDMALALRGFELEYKDWGAEVEVELQTARPLREAVAMLTAIEGLEVASVTWNPDRDWVFAVRRTQAFHIRESEFHALTGLSAADEMRSEQGRAG